MATVLIDLWGDPIVRDFDSLQMMFSFALEDWMAVDPLVRRVDCREERINVPANPRNYWNYRMHLSVENLLGRTEFNAAVAEMIAGAGR